MRWGIVTDATVELDGSTAILSKSGKILRVEILSPAGARFDLLSTDPGDARQNANEGTRMLATTVLPAGDRSLTLAVLLTPIGAKWPQEAVPA